MGESLFSEGENTANHFSPLTPLITMKKIIVLCSMIVALGFVTGCTGDKPAPTNPTTPASGSTTGTDAAASTDAAAGGADADKTE